MIIDFLTKSEMLSILFLKLKPLVVHILTLRVLTIWLDISCSPTFSKLIMGLLLLMMGIKLWFVRILKLKDLLFVDGLEENLITIRQICEDKCLVKFNEKECIMCDIIVKVIIRIIKSEENCYCFGDSPSHICNRVSLGVEKLSH